MSVTIRTNETAMLDNFFSSKKSEFLAIYGRRRVGKTFLIGNYFKKKKCKFLSVTGIEKGSFLRQRTECCKKISETFYNGVPLEVPKDWFRTFELINNALSSLPKTEKIVLFFDEFPWMATPRSNLLQAIEYSWNNVWCHDKRIKLIICGSMASWIIKNIINNTGGLYKRVTYRLKLDPLTLGETQSFLKAKSISLNPQQILALYMATGGIPLYLEQAQKGLSANQIIDQLCFNKNGILVNEIKELFKALFRDSETYLKIIREIAKHRYGIEKNELAKRLRIPISGRFTERLTELEDTGFIQSFLPYQHRQKGAYFRVTDEYTLFYFRWIEPNLRSIQSFGKASGFWMEKAKESSYTAWAGYAFESICYKHIYPIMKTLSLKPSALPYAWKYIPKKGEDELGAQIDLFFDRDDHCITLCEIKLTDKPFLIDKAYAKILNQKIEIFRKTTGTQKQIFLVMISASGVKKNFYSEDLVHGTVSLKDLFQ